MKKIRWSLPAANDLEEIHNHIDGHNPLAAPETIKSLVEAIRSLKTFPMRGKPGAEEGTRELVCAPLPYIVIYRLTDTHVELLRIWHGAQHR